MALDAPSRDQMHSAAAAREGASQAIPDQPRVAPANPPRVTDGFLTPKMSERVLADSLNWSPSSAPGDTPVIPARQFQQGAQTGAPPMVASPAVAEPRPQTDAKSKSSSQPPQHATAAHGHATSPKPAASTIKFDPKTGMMMGKGTIDYYLAQQLGRNGGVVVTDRTLDGPSVAKVKAMSGNLANLIARAPGVKVLYTDVVTAKSDQALLDRLVRGDQPSEADVNELSAKMKAASTTDGVADTPAVTRDKLRAYVGILRAAHVNGIAVKPLTDGVIKALGIDRTKGKDDPTRSTPDTYIILASETKQHKNVDLAVLPTLRPVPDMGRAFKEITTSGSNSVMFDPALTSTPAKTIKPG